MKQVRLFLVIAALVGLGYFAVHRGLVHDFSLVKARPSPTPTHARHVHRRRHHRHFAEREKAQPPGFAPEKHKSVAVLPAARPTGSPAEVAALHPGSSTLQIPAAAGSPKPEAAKTGFPASFEGCWEGTVNQPDTWEFGHGPILKGWAPADYVLCFHHSGTVPKITFSTSPKPPDMPNWSKM